MGREGRGEGVEGPDVNNPCPDVNVRQVEFPIVRGHCRIVARQGERPRRHPRRRIQRVEALGAIAHHVEFPVV